MNDEIEADSLSWIRENPLVSERGTRNSHAATWTIAIMVLVAVMYLVSVPAIVAYRERNLVMGEVGHPDVLRVPHGWIRWMRQKTPLQKPLEAYETWCHQTFGVYSRFGHFGIRRREIEERQRREGGK
jgi:hypothetical protein